MYTALILGLIAAGSMMGYFAANSSLETSKSVNVTEAPVSKRNLTFFLIDPPKFTRRFAEMKLVPTAGEAWPKPWIESKLNYYYNVSSDFSIKVTNHNCKILVEAVNRYVNDLKTMYKMASHRPVLVPAVETGPWDHGHMGLEYQGLFSILNINLTEPCESYPYHGMDESYRLEVTSQGTLSSSSVWGVLRGLETASQLFYFSNSEIRINATSIIDLPAYPHRGFLLDTERHHVSVETIFKVLDAMAMNKMNVFHWHIVGNASFPYKSKQYPELSEKGAMSPSMVYSAADIGQIIEYARMRGIMVYPEVNVPANVNSWAQSHPELVLQCSPGSDILNPFYPGTYKLLWHLFKELSELFPDNYFHIGGGGVNLYCFYRFRQAPPETSRPRRKNGTKIALEAYEKFTKRIMELVNSTKTLVVWQDVYDKIRITLPKNVIVQVYEEGWVEEMTKLVSSGHRLILSAPWDLEGSYSEYLEQSFAYYYSQHPRAMVRGLVREQSDLNFILGGEVCMWTHYTKDENIISTAWPRASAVAETLWSARADPARPSAHTLRRAGEQARRMRRRGLVTGKFI